MGSRIESLVSLFDLKERYIVSGENVNCEYVSSLSEIDYTREFPKFIEARQSSFNFLKDSLAGVRGKESGYED